MMADGKRKSTTAEVRLLDSKKGLRNIKFKVTFVIETKELKLKSIQAKVRLKIRSKE